MSQPIIEVENLSKLYKIGEARTFSIRESFDYWWAKARGKKYHFRSKYSDTFSSAQQGPEPNTFWALKDVSFKVDRGEAIGIIGRNGAGKSTALKILSRITEPTSGRAILRGRVASILEVGTGFHGDLTGRENIYLNGAILGMRKWEIDRKFKDILEFAEVEKFIDTPVKHYSSGMYVRLAFAVAAHLDSEILIVDEVLAVGDYAFQAKCMGKMKDVATKGRTVIFVSHNIAAIEKLCSKAILLRDGQLELYGTPSEAIKNYVMDVTTNRSCFEQPPDPKVEIRIRKVWLVSSSEEAKNKFRFDEPIQVKIEYTVNWKIKNTCIWIGIFSMEGTTVFASADMDSDDKCLEGREAGDYKATVHFPVKWINAGNYKLVVGVAKRPNESIERVEALNFTITDHGTPEDIRWGGRRGGVLQPFLNWETSIRK